MPTFVDMPRCQGLWDEQDVNLYNAYPFFIAANQYERIQNWMVWDKLTGEIPWEPNMGLTIRGVNAEPTPVTRQLPVPNAISALPMKDVMSVRERKEEEPLYGHNFESPLIHWLPSFKDWRQNQMDFAIKDINEKQQVYVDQFYRAKIWGGAPNVWICGAAGGVNSGEMYTAPIGPLTVTMVGPGDFKKLDWCFQMATLVPNTVAGTLSLRQVYKAYTTWTEDIDVPPFEGAYNMPKDGMGLPGKWCLVTSVGATKTWIDDTYLQAMKPLDLDTPHDGFHGDLFGNVRIKYERWPLRMKLSAGADTVSFPTPQTYEANPGAVNYGQTVPNPDYLKAEFEWAFLVGAEPWRTIRIGPPPKDFAGGRMSQSKFNKLQWNGEAKVTDNVLRQCLDAAGTLVLDTNKYGELLQIINDSKMGCIARDRRYVLPILFRRANISTTK